MDIGAILARHVVFPLWLRKNRSEVGRLLQEYERTQFLPPDELRLLQRRRLKALLSAAAERIPFYRARFREAGLRPEQVEGPEDLAVLPPLRKEDIQRNGGHLRDPDIPEERLLRDQTGGSTGAPLVFHYDSQVRDERLAGTLRHNRWTGWRVGDRVALLWGAAVDLQGYRGFMARWRNRLLDRTMVLDASSITEEKLRLFVDAIDRIRARFVLAYANTAAAVADHLRKRPLRQSPDAVVTSAEFLTDENRDAIERGFRAPVFNRYGCREFAVVASECEVHAGLHINAESLVVEVVDEEGHPLPPGETGEILVTDLRNHAMPFIRYQIGDVGRLRGHPCSCGRGLPLLELCGGRITDFITTPEGRSVSGVALATYAITNVPGIHKVQLIQGALAHLTVRLVKGADFGDETIRTLSENLRRFLGPTMEIGYEFPDAIPPAPSGKQRFSISHVPPAFARSSEPHAS